VLDDGSECDVSSRDQFNNVLTSSSGGSSLSDSDSDALMVSQELRPGFSTDRGLSTGAGRSLKADKNHDRPDAHSEVDRQLECTVDCDGHVGGQFAE